MVVVKHVRMEVMHTQDTLPPLHMSDLFSEKDCLNVRVRVRGRKVLVLHPAFNSTIV